MKPNVEMQQAIREAMDALLRCEAELRAKQIEREALSRAVCAQIAAGVTGQDRPWVYRGCLWQVMGTGLMRLEVGNLERPPFEPSDN